MELISASLCDFAADYQGKLCVLGAFDTIGAKQYPAVHPQCSIALIPASQSPNIDFDVPPLPSEAFFLSRNFVLHFQGLPLPQPGQYEIRILIDERAISTLPLQFVQVKEVS